MSITISCLVGRVPRTLLFIGLLFYSFSVHALQVLQLSTLDSSNGFRVDGPAPSTNYGNPAGTAGDVNGDGLADMAVSAPNNNPEGVAGAGSFYVIFGTHEKPENFNVTSLDGNDGFRLDGVSPNESLGIVSALGDVNGDGFDDMLLGTTGASYNGNASGSVYVVFGKADWSDDSKFNVNKLDGTNGFRIDGSPGDSVGVGISIVDINNDGYEDVAVAALNSAYGGERSGSLYVLFGKTDWSNMPVVTLSNINGTNGFRFDGSTAHDSVGLPRNAGDVNGDGISDLAVGVRAIVSSSLAGRNYLIFGKTTWEASPVITDSYFDGNTGFRLDGAEAGDAVFSVGAAGDINGDGYDDVVAGSSQLADSAGGTFVVFGKPDWSSTRILNLGTLDGSNGFAATGETAGDSAIGGISAGDVDGDGYDDLLIGARGADYAGSESGSAYLLYGRHDWSASSSFSLDEVVDHVGFRLDGAGSADLTGMVGPVGDFNGDGLADILIGAPNKGENAANQQHGAAYLIYGRPKNAGFADSAWMMY